MRRLFCPLLAATLLGAVPGAAQQEDRWQLMLADGTILWEVHLVALRGDSLVFTHVDTLCVLPIKQVDELRLVQKAERAIIPEAGRYAGVLNGAEDVVYRLTLFDVAERRQVIEQVLRDHPPQKSP